MMNVNSLYTEAMDSSQSYVNIFNKLFLVSPRNEFLTFFAAHRNGSIIVFRVVVLSTL